MRTKEAVATLLTAFYAGCTLPMAAARAGVHVATVCRWQAADPALRELFAKARRQARDRLRPTPEQRPHVRWRRDCPLCRAKVVVRTARGRRFWRCGRWPLCEWASWRPRAPRNCRHCGSPRYWSHSRKSIACGGCGVRIMRL
jgi:hypothetical protein